MQTAGLCVCVYALQTAGLCVCVYALQTAGLCVCVYALQTAGLCVCVYALETAGLCVCVYAVQTAGLWVWVYALETAGLWVWVYALQTTDCMSCRHLTVEEVSQTNVSSTALQQMLGLDVLTDASMLVGFPWGGEVFFRLNEVAVPAMADGSKAGIPFSCHWPFYCLLVVADIMEDSMFHC